jgi:uncharacterized membrane protein YphA (DoxX/SURF4 family)
MSGRRDAHSAGKQEGAIMNDNRSTGTMLLVARLLLAACLVQPATAHALNVSGLAFAMAQKGMPFPGQVASLVLVSELFGPLALALGIAHRLSAGILIASSVITTGTLHRFWEFAGAARTLEQAVFTGQLGLIAALLLLMVAGPGSFSLQSWLHSGGTGTKKLPKKKAARPRSSKPRPAPARPAPEESDLADAA